MVDRQYQDGADDSPDAHWRRPVRLEQKGHMKRWRKVANVPVYRANPVVIEGGLCVK
jgi:hypothetical protein